MCSDCENTGTTIDVRMIAPRLRHPLIFNTFENLGGGESFRIVNDHDPKPLFYQFSNVVNKSVGLKVNIGKYPQRN